MNDTLDWSDVHEIGFRRSEAHPALEELTVRFTYLHRWVLALEGFEGEASRSNEALLEAIQMASIDERKD